MRNVRIIAAALAGVTLTMCSSPAQQGAQLPNVGPGANVKRSHDIRRLSGSSPITHVIVIVQENRTPDDLFQGLPGADIQSWGLDSFGHRINLKSIPLEWRGDLSHTHTGFNTEYAGGNINGFNLEKASRCQQGDCAYGYVPQYEVQPYLDMATQYVFGDRMFQTNQGPSFPAHQELISGTAAALPATSDEASSNPLNHQGDGPGGGCDSKAGTLVDTINAQGVEGNPVFPCFDRPTITDLLDQGGQGWRYYQARRGAGLWNAMDAIQHIRYGKDYANVITPSAAVLTDIQNGNLQALSFVIPDALHSDHSGNGGSGGPSWVSSIVNAVGRSQYWDSTAIIVTWDDWGGWYDHVAPPIRSSYQLGFRVPLLVISPYAKSGYVSHVQHDFGSILHFIETVYGLPSLGTADSLADDLSDCFTFSQKPRAFSLIKAPKFVPATRSQNQEDLDY